MAVHSWSLIELDDDYSTERTRSLSTDGVFLIQHVPNSVADQNGIVTESIRVLFEADGAEDAVDISQEVESYFTQAARHAQGYGAKIFLLFSRSDESETWRSPVVSGLIEWHPDALRAYASGKIEGTLIIQRENYWERHDAEETLGTGTITNDGDSRLALSAPSGSMPAPVRVELENTSLTSLATRQFFWTLNTDSSPDNNNLAYTVVSPSAWTTDQSHNILYGEEEFSDTVISRLRGERFHVLLGLTSVTGTFYMRANTYTTVGGSKLLKSWTGERYISTERIIHFGALTIPPQGTGVNTTGISVALTVRNGAGEGSHDFAADWLMLMPASGFRKMTQLGYNIADGDIWVDDGIDNRAWVYDASASARLPIIDVEGIPPTVTPGKVSALRVVFDEETIGVDDTRTVSATVYCRPRRYTL